MVYIYTMCFPVSGNMVFLVRRYTAPYSGMVCGVVGEATVHDDVHEVNRQALKRHGFCAPKEVTYHGDVVISNEDGVEGGVHLFTARVIAPRRLRKPTPGGLGEWHFLLPVQQLPLADYLRWVVPPLLVGGVGQAYWSADYENGSLSRIEITFGG